jgi:hypothetical protein
MHSPKTGDCFKSRVQHRQKQSASLRTLVDKSCDCRIDLRGLLQIGQVRASVCGKSVFENRLAALSARKGEGSGLIKRQLQGTQPHTVRLERFLNELSLRYSSQGQRGDAARPGGNLVVWSPQALSSCSCCNPLTPERSAPVTFVL